MCNIDSNSYRFISGKVRINKIAFLQLYNILLLQDTANTERSKEAVVANIESGKEVSGESKVDSKRGGDADEIGGDDGAPPESDGASKSG